MKKRFIFYIFFIMALLFVGSVMAEVKTLLWDNGDPGNVQGYILYFSDDPTEPEKYYKTIVGEENTSITFSELHLWYGVTYEFYVRAYNSTGKSIKSNRISATMPPFVPPGDNLPAATSWEGPESPVNIRME